jgi:hypothetical protein
LFGGLTFQEKRKAFRLDSKFEKNFKKIGRRKESKATEIIMIY